MLPNDYLPQVKDPSLWVGMLLEDKGATLISEGGEPLKNFSNLERLGIIIGEPFLPEKEFIGVLSFDDEQYGSNGKSWVLRICSENFIDVSTKLIGYILDNFSVAIRLSLSIEPN